MTPLRPYSTRRSPASQYGFTLIELMVALVIGLFIALAAAAALVVARQGFTAVDSGGQLRENARFTADLMQRIVVQAGFEDVANGSYDRQLVAASPVDDPKWPGIIGYDNAWYPGGDPITVTNDSRTSGCGGVTDTSCNNFSDVLVVRYQGTSDSTGAADGSMIDCAGFAEPYQALAGTRAFSVFYLTRTPDLEPALACGYINPTSGVWETRTLVKGVEGFQVLYGTDGATSSTAPPAGSTGMHGTVNRYLTAKDLTVSGNVQATQDNWRRVRTLRIALLFRADVGSLATRGTANTAWDMRGGTGFQSSLDTAGNSLSTVADGRLRQIMVFTVHLRNQQGYDVCTNPATPC